MKTRSCWKLGSRLLTVAALFAASSCSTSFAAEKASPREVEAKIEIGVASAKADEAMKSREPVKAFKLLLDLVKKYPGNVGALHKYYDFLLNHRIKLSEEERAAALEYARTIWPAVESLADVFLIASGDLGIKELFAEVADDKEALNSAFTELESALRDDHFKTLAFYAYVATAHADKVIAGNARVGVGEVLLRCGDHQAAENEFQQNCLDLYLPPEDASLWQRVEFGKGRARENLGKTNEAAIDYKMAWQYVPESELGQAAAERLARIRVNQGRPGEAFAWCLRVKSSRPASTFSDKQLDELYSSQMKAVGGRAERMASSLREAIERGGDPAEALAEKERVSTLLAGLGQDPSGETYAERARAVRARALLRVSAGVLDIFQDPDSIVSRAEDLGHLSAAVYLTESRKRERALDPGLLKASDAMIESALREALVKNTDDGRNSERLAAAHLYYAATRADGGRSQLDQVVSSFSKDIEGLDKLYSSREVREKTASVCKAAGLLANMQAEAGAFVEHDIGAAQSAEALKRLATQALDAGRPGLAIAALERIQSEFADQTDAAELTYLLAEAYLQNAEWARAKKTFTAYIEEERKDEARRIEAQYLSALSDFYARDYGEAALHLFRFCRKYAAADSAANASHLAMVACSRYAESGDISPAVKRELLLALVKRFPETEMAAEAHYQLGRILLYEEENYSDALKAFQAALAGRRCDEASHYTGVCYQRLGVLDQAAKWYQRVIRDSKGDGARNAAKRALERLNKTSKESQTRN